MNIRLYHASQVVGEATNALVANGSTRERLLVAASLLLGITPREFEDFPELQSQWKAIDDRLSVAQDAEAGSYRKSVEQMSGPKMRELSALILGLDRAIRSTE